MNGSIGHTCPVLLLSWTSWDIQLLLWTLFKLNFLRRLSLLSLGWWDCGVDYLWNKVNFIAVMGCKFFGYLNSCQNRYLLIMHLWENGVILGGNTCISRRGNYSAEKATKKLKHKFTECGSVDPNEMASN